MKPATFDELKVGDRVTHTACGPGVVTAKSKTVDVEFDAVGKNGRHWRGKYDRDWFLHAGCRLTKITTEAPRP